MTELTPQEKKKCWDEIKIGWNKMKDSSLEDKTSAKKQINDNQKKLGLEVTKWNDDKPTKFIPIEFKIINKDEQEDIKNNTRYLFEMRNLVEEVAIKEFPQYSEKISIGQALNLVSANKTFP